jgi:serine/threonine-protein kinase RsbW
MGEHDEQTVRQTAVFPARLDALPRLAAFVEETASHAGFGHRDRLRLVLVVEELFTNTVRHGYRGDSDQPVTVSVEIGRDHVRLTYEDAGPAFDPTRSTQAAEALSTRADAGGHGLRLITGIPSEVRYSRVGARNCVSLIARASS